MGSTNNTLEMKNSSPPPQMAKKTARALELNGGCCSPMEFPPNDCVVDFFKFCWCWLFVVGPCYVLYLFVFFFSFWLFVFCLFVFCVVFFCWLACLFLFVGVYWFVDWLVSVFLGLFLSWFVGCLVICAVWMFYFDSRGGISNCQELKTVQCMNNALCGGAYTARNMYLYTPTHNFQVHHNIWL